MIGKTQYQAKAKIDGEGVAITVTASCGYGKRRAAVSREITDKKVLSAVKGLLTDAVKSVEKDLDQEATAAAYEALLYATKKGEKV